MPTPPATARRARSRCVNCSNWRTSVPARRSSAFARYCIASEALQSIETATTVRIRQGKLSVTDGPFAETKEQLAGFYLITARDLNEAIHLAAGIPPARVGSIEVRPIRPIREMAEP
ncbi:MAG: hypothetical protein HY895_03665 [Deltaproteobacteria bacterium]|nr:hypothetical protein [Deltaproteobacteria bacterium]